jgi:hypothetical protein
MHLCSTTGRTDRPARSTSHCCILALRAARRTMPSNYTFARSCSVGKTRQPQTRREEQRAWRRRASAFPRDARHRRAIAQGEEPS